MIIWLHLFWWLFGFYAANLKPKLFCSFQEDYLSDSDATNTNDDAIEAVFYPILTQVFIESSFGAV